MKDFSQKLLEYYTGQFGGLNLTRILDPDEFYHKQVLDSVIPFRDQDVRAILDSVECLVDVGFGGGFPIIPLLEELKDEASLIFYGIDARRKKCDAVRSIIQSLGHKAIIQHGRLETFLFDRPTLITIKAVGKICDLLPKIHTSAPVKVLFYKGPLLREQEKLENIPQNWKFVFEKDFDVQYTDGRKVLLFETVPHGTTQSKQLQSLSLLK